MEAEKRERERNKNSNKNHDILRWIEVTINKFKYPNFITYNSNKIEENDKKSTKKTIKQIWKKMKADHHYQDWCSSGPFWSSYKRDNNKRMKNKSKNQEIEKQLKKQPPTTPSPRSTMINGRLWWSSVPLRKLMESFGGWEVALLYKCWAFFVLFH